MAVKKRGRVLFDSQKFAQCLGGLIDSLPSEADKQQIVSQLVTLIQFLSDLKARLESIPTHEDTGTARAAADKVAALFEEAKSNPVLAAAVGIKTTGPRPRPPAITSEEIERAKSTIARFESVPIDEIRSALEGMSVRDLRGVAKAIGIRTTERTARETLVHQVAIKITNTRGYRSLRDGTNQP